jgi:hypothetical protein
MRQVTFRSFRLSLLIALIAVSSILVHGQFRAGIQGTVADSSGALIPGATLILTNQETKQTQTTQSSDDGFYRFSSLAPGQYSVSIEKAGFKKAIVEDIKVDAESVKGQDVILETGGITEVVTINAEADAVAVESEDANIRKTITTDEVLRLPQSGRDPYELARLAPGVFGAGARAGDGNSVRLPNTEGPGGSNIGIFATENVQPISANGQRVSSNNYQIDGTSVNSQTWGGGAVITPSQESVKEVQVTSSTYSAEDGRNSGALIKVVTRNGTNDWHGSAFFKLNDPSLNAFNTMPRFIGNFDTGGPQRVNRKFKTYGGSLGGPLPYLRFGEIEGPYFSSGKDRLFFFFAYEGLTESSSSSFRAPIETSAFRSSVIAARPGTVTSAILSSTGIEPRVNQILTATCEGISGACAIVGDGMDVGSVTGSYNSYVPLGQTDGGGLDGIADLQWALLDRFSKFKGNQFTTRIDFNATSKDRFTFSSFIVPNTALTSDDGAQSRPQADVNSKRLSYALGFIYNRAISASMTNEARFNVTRWGYDETESNPDANLGLPRVEIEAVTGDRLRWGFPRSENTPGLIEELQFDLRDVVTKVWGNHVLKFGGEYRRDLNKNGEVGGARPFYVFNRLWNFANGTPIFQVVSATLEGQPAANNTEFVTSEVAFFVQDDWKLHPTFTLNLGLRWSYYSPVTASNGVLGNLQLGPTAGLAGASIVTEEKLYDSDFDNFGPQLGFAWAPGWSDSKFVLRGGAGMGFDRLPNALLANARRNPPNGGKFEICCGTAATDFGSPFVGGLIEFNASADGTIFGYPAFTLLGGGTNPATGLPLSGTVEIYGAPRNLDTPYVIRYSLEAQYELPANLIASLAYQGSAGRHFVRILPLHIMTSTNPNIRAAYFASSDVNSSYNAFIARLHGRFLEQFSFDTNYRFAKSIDTASWEAPSALTNQTFPVDQREERGRSDFDVRHAWVAAGTWDLPFFTGNSTADKILGGWQISGIATYHSGFPWTPRIGGCLQGTTSASAQFCDPRPTALAPNSPGITPGENTNENFLRPFGLFGVPGTAIFSTAFNSSNPFENRPIVGRNVFNGPKYFSLDMSFAKRFKLGSWGFVGEDAAIDFRFNFFNILNTLNLTPFNANTGPTRVPNLEFGTATTALAGRVGEFQVRFSF